MPKFKLKNKKIISVLIILSLGLIYGLFFTSHTEPKKIYFLPNPTSKTYEVKTTPKSNDLIFKNDTLDVTTVYDFMKKLKNEGKVNYTEKNYIGMGEFIDSINGIKNNRNQSWIYYVNGIEAQVGVSNYKIKIGDTVSWKYEK